ncbi:MAG TPA: hypothetical protein VD767_02420 [Thermomicrobiales bacterium]|nr:hypothetical protein [Thermomicrobiales bacterium]
MTSSPDQEPPRKIVVPGGPLRTGYIATDDEFEGMVSQEEISSASRSCLAIIIGLLIIAGFVCVFLVWKVVA